MTFNILEGKYHSFDSYYKNVAHRGNTLIIPYINLGIYEHKLNPSSTPIYLNKAYVILRDVTYLKVYGMAPIVDYPSSQSEQELFFGGMNLDNSSHFVDMEIRFGHGELKLTEDWKLSKSLWIPIATPNFLANMNADDVNLFFLSADRI
jgi:hypothetical protein